MDNKFKALEISELLPRRGRPPFYSKRGFVSGTPVLIGDDTYGLFCQKLYYTIIDHNNHAQGYIIFTNGEKFWYFNQAINGKKAFLFEVTDERLGIARRKDYQNRITNFIPSASTCDLIAEANLILESVGKEKKKQRTVPESSQWWPNLEKKYRNVATEQILSNLNRLSVQQLEDLWKCISSPQSSPKREATTKAA